jgi:hypothetical protein
MAGDITQAKQVCREYCWEVGLCVTIEPTTYIYTAGEEEGFRVRLINYPRFPNNYDGLRARAVALAARLAIKCCQRSYTIAGPDTTEWFTLDAPGAA